MALLKVPSNPTQGDLLFDPTLIDEIRLGAAVNQFSTSVSGGIFNKIFDSSRNPSTITYTGTNSITLTGGFGGGNKLTTGAGNDYIDSKNTSSAQSKFDILTGGNGDDYYDLRSIFATVIEGANGGFDTVRTGISIGQRYIIPNNVEKVILKGANASSLLGNAANNELVGNDGDNGIRALGGNDRVFGRGGADSISGGDGDDYLDGGSGDDTILADNGNDELIGGLGNDLLLGLNGNDKLFGGDGNDTLEGGSGDDLLEGGSGNDVLKGTNALRAGDRDMLRGGTGNDDFILGNSSNSFYQGSGFAEIRDFETGDRILVGGSVGNYRITALGGDSFEITRASSPLDRIALVNTVGGATVTLTQIV